MKKIVLLLLFSIITVLLAACSLLQEPEAASGPIEAVPVVVDEAESENTTTDGAETMAEDSDSTRIYAISPEGSQVRFELDEDLRGERITVVGTTDQVAGEIAANLADLSDVQVGTIQINARTLVTDNNFRNRALNNRILQTDLFEFITFMPTAVNGLPASVNPGESVDFTIVGDLTVREITNEVTFEVKATAVSADELNGTASTVINLEDYNLVIPSVPNVANVEEQVYLFIDFTETRTS